MRRALAIIFIFVFCKGAWAGPNAPKVIDLGEGESKSSVRKPHLRVVESQATVNALLPKIYRSQFEATEARLLKPQQSLTGDTRAKPGH